MILARFGPTQKSKICQKKPVTVFWRFRLQWLSDSAENRECSSWVNGIRKFPGIYSPPTLHFSKMTMQINFFVFSRWVQRCTSDRPKMNTLEHSSVFYQWGTFRDYWRIAVGLVLCQELQVLGNHSTLQYKFTLLKNFYRFFEFFSRENNIKTFVP